VAGVKENANSWEKCTTGKGIGACTTIGDPFGGGVVLGILRRRPGVVPEGEPGG